MKKIYVKLPSMGELEKLLTETFSVSDSLADAEVVVTDDEVESFSGRLIITVADTGKNTEAVFINKNLPTEVIYHSIKTAVETYSLSSSAHFLNSPHHLLKDCNPKVSYFVKKLENILNAAAESILEIDEYGNVLFHNKKFAATYDSVNTVFDGSLFSVFDVETAKSVKNIISEIKSDTPIEFIGRIRTKKGTLLPIEGHISIIPGDNLHYEIIFEDISEKLLMRQKIKKSEEQTIITGFARHLSHNVMNALTAAGGFIKKVQAQTENSLYTQNLWHIINDKLMLIEEIVAGYNDYTHATMLKKNEIIDFAEFFTDLIKSIHDKNIDRNFTAYLYKLTDNYNLTYDFSKTDTFFAEANKMFLKLALCYILKDNIRYFSGNLPIEYKVTVQTLADSFKISILAANVNVSEQIISTMLKPWDHKMLAQSFDYWGIMIAAAIIEKHNGEVIVSGDGSKLRLDLVFNKV